MGERKGMANKNKEYKMRVQAAGCYAKFIACNVPMVGAVREIMVKTFVMKTIKTKIKQ